MVGICPGGICPGGICPAGICPGGICPGGICPAGICPDTTKTHYGTVTTQVIDLSGIYKTIVAGNRGDAYFYVLHIS